jgi:hypothetical protein
MIHTIRIVGFPTHIKVSNKSRKTGQPRYEKISGQSLYSGNMHHSVRDKIVALIRNALNDPTMTTYKVEDIEYPKTKSKMIHIMYTLIPHYGGIRIQDGKLKIARTLRWDLDNLDILWRKKLIDELVKRGAMLDDSIEYITKHVIDSQYYQPKEYETLLKESPELLIKEQSIKIEYYE